MASFDDYEGPRLSTGEVLAILVMGIVLAGSIAILIDAFFIAS